MSVTTGISLTEHTVAELSEKLGEPAWMREKRAAAWRAYQDLDLPRWDRTDLTGLSLDQILVDSAPSKELSLEELPESLRAIVDERSEDSVLVLQADSARTWVRLPQRLQDQGVVVCDFQTALSRHEEVFKEHFMSVVPLDEDKFTALHYAATTSGLFVYVPKNVAVDIPIEFRIYTDTPGLALFPHVLVVADQGAEVTVIEGTSSVDGDEQRIVSHIVELCPRDGAQIRFGWMQNWDEKTFNFKKMRGIVNRDARIEWMGGDFGSRLSHSHSLSILEGDGSESTSYSTFFGVNTQHLDVGTTMRHVGEHTSSDMETKGVLDDHARVVYRGLTDIEAGARYTSGFQREFTMLLSKDSRSDAIPGLEIDDYEVQAGHAAIVGPIDPVFLFYLMSRGVHKEDAIRLIVEGFFDPLLQRIQVDGVRDELVELIAGKMAR